MLQTFLALLQAAPLLALPALPGAATPATSAPPVADAAGPDTVRLVDDLGDTLALAEPADRIVSLIPAVTEILFALGAGDRLVGRTRYGVHPPRARQVPDVGEGIRPATELVVAREPDLVVAYAGPENRRAVEELRRAGLPVLALSHDRLAHLEENVRRLGRVTGCAERAAALGDRIRAGLGLVREATAGRPAPRVYYDVWADPPITIGAGSYLDGLLHVAGARNVFGDLSAPSPRVSLEAIVARDPDLVLTPRDGSGERTEPGERVGWRALRAVREGRVRSVDGDLVHRLGPRLPEAAAALAEAIHPGAGAARAVEERLEPLPDSTPCRRP